MYIFSILLLSFYYKSDIVLLQMKKKKRKEKKENSNIEMFPSHGQPQSYLSEMILINSFEARSSRLKKKVLSEQQQQHN